MKRKLISQMRNEWRSNVWMTVELIIVGVVLWVIFTAFGTIIHMHQSPKGIDFSDIYVGRIGVIPKEASTYRPYADSLHNIDTDLEMLLVNLRSNPLVVNAGTGINAIPYNYNYSGNCLFDKETKDFIYHMANYRRMDPDLIRTLRITGCNGESPEQLSEMVAENKLLISTIEGESELGDSAKHIGHEAIMRDSTEVFMIGSIINGFRRVDYEQQSNGVVIMNIPHDWFPSEIAVRIQPGKSREFIESLEPSQLSFGNVYISNLTDIEKRKDSAHIEFHNFMRNLTACAVFLMTAVFLGILGSFWFRTQQRVPELALRKVNGATDRDIFGRFISEGLMLLAISAVFISAIVALIIYTFDISEWIAAPAWLYWTTLPVTFIILAVMIIAGIAFPARRAMKVKPAEALKDQ